MNFHVMPGQFAKFIWNDDEWEFNRSYSVVSYKDWVLAFCIKIVPNWRWGAILSKLKEWDKVYLWWVYWSFVLQDTPNDKVFIATWTWLSPIIAMLEKAKNSKNYLFFWVKWTKDVFYEDMLSALPNLELNIYCSELKENTWNYLKWRINLDDREFAPDTEFYICWNPEMLKWITAHLEKRWFTNVYFEKY